jgi:RNA polymerase sigma-70 factor (ECF subfamily)
MDEMAMLVRIGTGDEQALESVIRQMNGYVVAIIRGRSRGKLSQEDLEEVASDVFVALWTHAAEIRPGHLKSWLASVARNKTADRLRRRRETVPLEDMEITVPDTLWHNLAREERRERVAAALASLSAQDREIFARYYQLCQSTQQIAQAMGMNPSTVRTRLSRGRETLKNFLCEGRFDYELEY